MERHHTHSPDHDPKDRDAELTPAGEIPIRGTPLEQVSAYLRISFNEAEARGGTIRREDAQAVATLLAALLDAESEMACFATSGEADKGALLTECQRLKDGTWKTPDTGLWIEQLTRYIQTQLPVAEQGAPSPADNTPNDPEMAAHVQEHGMAFRAYLYLPDTDPHASDLVQKFQEHYVGSFGSREELLEGLTDLRAVRDAVRETARQWSYEMFVEINLDQLEYVVREAWDISEVEGRRYVFRK
jgi:hypothetical protein